MAGRNPWGVFDARMRLEEGRTVHEPPGQDGFNCLLLAALHQVTELGLGTNTPPGFDVHQLRARCRSWLRTNSTLLFGDACLCDFGEDYHSFVNDDHAWGNQVVLYAIMGVFLNMFQCSFSAKVCGCGSFDHANV